MTRRTPRWWYCSRHGRNPIWNEGDDVKMWQLRSGLLTGARVERSCGEMSGYLPPPRPLPVFNRRLVGGRKRLMIMSGCHLRHFSFRASTIPSFPSPGPPSWTYNHPLYARPFFLPRIYLSYPLRISSSPQAPPLPPFPCSHQILPLPSQYIHPLVKK
jgi:hypothetical protein